MKVIREVQPGLIRMSNGKEEMVIQSAAELFYAAATTPSPTQGLFFDQQQWQQRVQAFLGPVLWKQCQSELARLILKNGHLLARKLLQ